MHADAENSDSIFAEDELLTTEAEHIQMNTLWWQKQELQRQLQCYPQSLSVEEMVYKVIEQYHDILSLDEGEQGETNLVEFNINSGKSTPIKQAAYRVPFATRQGIAAQLNKMREEGVIQLLNSPWISPVVLVRK